MTALLRFLRDERGEMTEMAVGLPVLLLVALGMLNLIIAGYAGMNAQSAAVYGARRGSVTQVNQIGAAIQAAIQSLDAAPVGDYRVQASGGGARGSAIRVAVDWSVPNFFGGLARMFGAPMTNTIDGSEMAVFRVEGW
ncbi:MAG: hypothetical protein HYZ49_05660 [Chloroflexi bacterium]|nr:hypothetical protein [Chloroflexota bacterium]